MSRVLYGIIKLILLVSERCFRKALTFAIEAKSVLVVFEIVHSMFFKGL